MSDALHFCETTEEGWRPCPPSFCEAERLFQENKRLREAIKYAINRLQGNIGREAIRDGLYAALAAETVPVELPALDNLIIDTANKMRENS